MQEAAIAVLVVVMMVAIGLRTHPGEFVEVGRRPAALLAMLLVNVVVVPACMALGLASDCSACCCRSRSAVSWADAPRRRVALQRARRE